MSPRRKSGLTAEDLQALKHLPAVLRALEHLAGEHAKVRALMGPPGEVRPDLRETAPGIIEYQGKPPSIADHEATKAAGAIQRSATLDTPERREYEEAKRAGRKVPVADPFANASPAQRERMAEQRAMIEAERAARGLPTRRGVLPPLAPLEGITPATRDETEEAAGETVRTETLDTLSDGTTPLADDADDEPEVH